MKDGIGCSGATLTPLPFVRRAILAALNWSRYSLFDTISITGSVAVLLCLNLLDSLSWSLVSSRLSFESVLRRAAQALKLEMSQVLAITVRQWLDNIFNKL